jgi:hypothetical protein
MPAPKGNSYWRLRKVSGQPKSLTPEELWTDACEYFEWCDSNPWIKSEAIKGGEHAGNLVQVPTSRPYTISGMCVFIGIDIKTFDNYSKVETYKDYFQVCTHIREIIYTQKFEGAAVGAYNANIIARDLGLKDTSDVNVNDNRKQVADLFPFEKEKE